MSDSKFLDKTGLTHFMSLLKTELKKKVSLGDDGKIPSSLLPSYIGDVVEFSGIIDDNIEIKQASTTSTSGSVIYSSVNKTFAYAVQSALSSEVTYYNNWNSRSSYCDDNFVPYSSKIYVDTETNDTYRWSGSSLISISGGDGGLVLGETSDTAYAGDKGAQNAKDIKAILSGDQPLVTPSIVQSSSYNYIWQIKSQLGSIVSTSTSAHITTIYGYLATFKGCLQWTHTDGYKDPTAIGDGAWSGKSLPASGAASEIISIEGITDTKTIVATIKAPKQGLVLSNGIIKEASSSDYDTASTNAGVVFQYKAIAAPVTTTVTSSSLQTLLAAASKGGSYVLQNSKAKTLTGVTTEEDEYYVYAYPSVLGNLSKITMNDATPLLSDGFLLTQINVTDPETGATLTYNVYTSVQRGAFTNAKLEMA